MKRNTKIAIAAAGGLGIIATGVAVLLSLNLLWGYSSGWPQVPSSKFYVSTQPKQEDIVGKYSLTRQTITTNGLAILAGRSCELELRFDGTFAVTNYPMWSDTRPSRVTALVSMSGQWHCDKIGAYYDRGQSHDIWAAVFDTQSGVSRMAFRSNGAPYDLMYIYGDGDDGAFVMFGRQK
jgi:hypothetical protein